MMLSKAERESSYMITLRKRKRKEEGRAFRMTTMR